MKKNRWKIAILGGVAAVFAIYITFTTNEASSNIKPFSRAKTQQDVKAYQYQHTPGLKRAESLGLTQAYHKKAAIAGTNKNLRIEKIWYNRKNVYLFYSVGPILKKEVTKAKPGKSRTLYLACGILSPNDKKGPNQAMRARGAGILYNGRLYQSIKFRPLKNAKGDPLPKVNDLILNRIQFHRNNETHKVGNIELPLHYKARQGVRKTFSLKKTYQIGDYQVAFDHFTVGTAENQLVFHFANPHSKEEFQALDMNVTSQGKKRDLFASQKNNGRFVYVTPPFDQYPEKVQIHVKALKMVERGSFFHFTVNLDQLKKTDQSVKVNRRIAKMKNTEIFLDKVTYNDKGLWVQIRYEAPDDQKIRLVPETPRFSYQDWRRNINLSTVIEAENKNYEYAHGGQIGSGPGPTFSFQLNASFLKGSHKIGVTIQNLPFEIRLDKTITVDTQKK